jgi:hypothetical protein
MRPIGRFSFQDETPPLTQPSLLPTINLFLPENKTDGQMPVCNYPTSYSTYKLTLAANSCG